MKESTFDRITMINQVFNRMVGIRNLKDSNTRCSRRLNLCYRAAVCGAILTCISVSIDELLTLYSVIEEIARVLYKTLIIFNTVSTICTHILCWNYVKELSQVRKRMAQVERKLTKLGVDIDHRSISIWLMLFYTLSTLNFLAFFLYYVYVYEIMLNTYSGWYIEILYNWISNIGVLVLVDFATYVCWLQNSFKQTNDLLKKLIAKYCNIRIEELCNETTVPGRNQISLMQKHLNDWISESRIRRNNVVPLNVTPNVNHRAQTTEKVHKFQEIRFVHLELCVIMKTVSKAFDLQLMFHITSVVLNLIAAIYFIYEQYSDVYVDFKGSIGTYGLYVVDAFYSYFKIALVSQICQNTIAEVKKIIRIVHTFSVYECDPELRNQIVLFSLHISLSDVEKEEDSFFRMNNNMTRQNIVTIATYAIGMIQWYQSMIQSPLRNFNSTVSNWNQHIQPTETVHAHS